jgi:hypothetical protein
MGRRIRRPEVVRLEISQGDWLLVKKHLTAGEQRAIFRRMMREGITSDRVDPVRVGWAKMVGYLLDWSIEDADGQPVVIRDKSEEDIGAALDALDVDSFREILAAIDTHEEAMAAELAAEKNGQATGSASSATSLSAAG